MNGVYNISVQLITTTVRCFQSLDTWNEQLNSSAATCLLGAVVGREFHYELMRVVAGLSRDTLDEALGQLVRSELIFRRGEIPDAVYTFKHALVRDAVYASLLKARRTQLHAAIGTALEEQFPDTVQTQPEILAQHFTEAGLIEKAIGHWLQAGKSAALRSANLEAIAHLQRGIELTCRLPADVGRDRFELDFQLVFGPCLIATQGPAASAAVATFGRARELCERLGQPPEYLQVMFWLATVSVVRRELPQALEAIAAAECSRSARQSAGTDQWDTWAGDDFHVHGTHRRGPRDARTRHRTVQRERGVQQNGCSGRWPGCRSVHVGSDGMGALDWRRDEAVSRIADALDAPTRPTMRTRTLTHGIMRLCFTLCGASRHRRGLCERCLAISEQHGFRQWLGFSARSETFASPCWVQQAANSTR